MTYASPKKLGIGLRIPIGIEGIDPDQMMLLRPNDFPCYFRSATNHRPRSPQFPGHVTWKLGTTPMSDQVLDFA